jgi:benzodiazapine receptor
MPQINTSTPSQAILLFLLVLLLADKSIAFSPRYLAFHAIQNESPSEHSRQHRRSSWSSPSSRPPLYPHRNECGVGRTRRISSITTRTNALPPSTGWVVSHIVAGCVGAPIVAKGTKSGGWYRTIDLPSWKPPDWLFGPVWTVLYALMGLAVSRIYNSSNKLPTIGSTMKNSALLLWAVHLTLNLIWAPVFFGLQRLRLGFIISTLMVVTLIMIIPMFYVLNASSAYLLLPYLAWITFATLLNKTICKLNPTQGGYNDAMFQAQLITLQQKAAKYADGL